MRHLCLMTKLIRPSSEEAIIEAAFDVLNNDPGASLATVADVAGVGRATLHRYFSRREDLLSAMARLAVKEMDEVVEAACADVSSYGEALRVTLEVLIPIGDRYSFLALDAIEHDPELQKEFARQRKETDELVEAAKREGVFEKSVPTSWISQAYEMLLFAAWESVKAGELTQTQAANLAWRTLTLGLQGDTK